MFLGACAVLAIIIAGLGCNSSEKEKEPIVSVQVTPAKRSDSTRSFRPRRSFLPGSKRCSYPKLLPRSKSFWSSAAVVSTRASCSRFLKMPTCRLRRSRVKENWSRPRLVTQPLPVRVFRSKYRRPSWMQPRPRRHSMRRRRSTTAARSCFKQGALPRRDLDSADVALAQARTESEVTQKQLDDLKRIGEKESLKSASGQLSAAHGKYLGASAQLSYSEIRSPIDGVVTDRPQYEGELATANQPLLTVMDTSRLIAKAHIAQSEAASLKVGNPAELRAAGLSEPVEGKVSLVSPALDPGSTTIEVWVESKKPNEALKPGMTVQLSITARSDKNAMVVPATAVFKNDDGADYVVLAGADGHAHFKTVSIGIRNAELVQITDGVKEGDSVITSGGYALPDKTQIKIESNPGDQPAEKPSPGSNSDSKTDKE